MNGIIFSQAGFQKTGWGKQLYDQERIIQEYFDQAEHILGTSTQKLAFNATASEMNVLPDSYALVYLLQASYVGYMKHQGIQLDRVAGIGVGAYAAGYAAGTFTFADGLYLISKWAALYNDYIAAHSVRKIAISGIRQRDILKNMPENIFISEIWSAELVSVSGAPAALEDFEQRLVKKFPDAQIAARDIELGIYGGLDDTGSTYRQYLEKVEFKDAEIPLVSSIDPVSMLTQSSDLKNYFGNVPCSVQQVSAVLERFQEEEIIFMPYAEQLLLELVQARYPEKRIEVVPV